MSVQILRGDARSLPLADESVDLIVTSPPYWSLRSYTDGGEHYAGQIGAEPAPAAYVDSLIECTREWVRVLKPTGSMWINLGDKYSSGSSGQNGTGKTGLYDGKAVPGTRPAGRHDRMGGRTRAVSGAPPKSLLGLPWRYAIRCVDDLGLILRAEVIWSKPNGLPESVTDRVRRSHETWFHFTKSPRYFAAVDNVREAHSGRLTPNIQPLSDRFGGSLVPGNTPRKTSGPDGMGSNPLGKLPGSVWEIATQPLKVPAELGIDHFAAFPMEWPRRIISGWSPTDGAVLDPFGGTGTAALVAHALGRHGVSVDMSADYCRLAQWRTSDSGQIAAAMQVPKPKVDPGLKSHPTIFDSVEE